MRRLRNNNSYSDGDDPTDSGSVGSDVSPQTEAVATAAALVGESVVDSPTHSTRRGFNNHSFTSERMRDMLAQYDGSQSTWMERGLQWWQNQKQRAQQQSLKRQVEEQRRKLVELEENAANNNALETNETFRQMMNLAPPDLEENSGVRVSSPQASKSGLGMSVQLSIEEEEEMWAPEAKVEEEAASVLKEFPLVLTQIQRQSLAALALPPGLMYCPWTRLYSLARDGDSFQTFVAKVKGHQHTLLVIRTTKNAIFGAYADSAWELSQGVSPEFFGSAQACLFRIEGDGARVFKWSGSNRYVQYIDAASKMVALGGGGGSFGLCVERDFQVGSTDRCSTFNNEPLCSTTNFEIVDVECYGFLTGVF